MALVTEHYHIKKLKRHGINIQTKYVVGNKILERNTNYSHNDDIKNGIVYEKNYYLNNNLIHTEKLFDSRIEYTYISKDLENKEHTCINCGMHSKQKDFIDGCPYCKTNYNIDYIDKDLGAKYHYDLVLKNNTYKKITLIIDIIISFILSFLYIKTTSRTFNYFDGIKIVIFGSVLSLILYYVFYLLDAYIILGPIKRYKEKQNQKQKEFWQRTKINQKQFFNNLNYEIRKLYYSQEDIIDYDIIDYIEYKDYQKDNKLYVDVTIEIRIISLQNNKIKKDLTKKIYTMYRHENSIHKLKEGTNLVKCYNCGSTIDINVGECTYCHSKTKYLQEWILIENKQN